MSSARVAAQPAPLPVVDPFAEPEPPEPLEPLKPVEPPEPKREDPKPTKKTDPAYIPPSLRMRPLPWLPKPPPPRVPSDGDVEPTPDARTGAAASDAEIEIDDDTPARPVYPRSFVLRPLVLPGGMRIGSFGSRLGRESFGDLELTYLQGYASAVVGLGGSELYGGVNFNLLHGDNADEPIDLPWFQSANIGVDWELVRNTALGLQGVLAKGGTGRTRYSPSVSVTHKGILSDRNAFYASGTVDYNHQNERDGADKFVLRRVGAYGGASWRTQPTPVFAMQVGGTMAYFKYIGDEVPIDDTYYAMSLGLTLMWSVSESTDVSTYVSISKLGGMAMTNDVDSGAVGLTISIR